MRKVRTLGPQDYPVRVALHSTLNDLITSLLTYARSQGVKLHDVLLAAVAEACARHVPMQARGKRTDVAVGTIVIQRTCGFDRTIADDRRSQSKLDDFADRL